MHELSIATAVVKFVADDARERCLTKVKLVRLVVGELAFHDPDTLVFALAQVSRGTVLEDACFEVVGETALAECPGCLTATRPEPPFYVCSHCGRGVRSFLRGREVRVDFYEGECG